MVKSTQIARIDGIQPCQPLPRVLFKPQRKFFSLILGIGLMLAASVDEEQVCPAQTANRNPHFFSPTPKNLELIGYFQADAELSEPKQNAKMVIRRLDRNSEPQASIEAGQYTLQCVSCSVLPFRREYPLIQDGLLAI